MSRSQVGEWLREESSGKVFWICSKCGRGGPNFNLYNYCPYCRDIKEESGSGCKNCEYESYGISEYPCNECERAYADKWKLKSDKRNRLLSEKAVRKMLESIPVVSGETYSNWLQRAYLGLDSIPDSEPEWISVNDIPPEDGENVLICDEYGAINIGYHCHKWKNSEFIQVGTCECLDNIVAWQPKPKSYKEESN